MNSLTDPNVDGPEPIRELARSFWYSAILRTAIKLGLFTLLDSRPLTAEMVAQNLDASPNHIIAFLESCTVLGLIEERDGKFSLTPLTSRFLVPGRQEYVGDHALHHTNAWASFGRLDEIIKEGKTLLPFETGYVDADTYWNNYMLGQHNRAESGQAYQLIKNVDLQNRQKLIDLGGGAGSYSIALCRQNPELNAVIVDAKEPLSVASALVKEHGLQNRIKLLEGDFAEIDLGSGYDVALISGVVLIKGESDCRRLFNLTYSVLEPGGMVVVQDYMRIDHSAERKKLDTLENLYVRVAFDPKAGDKDGELVASWLRDSGFLETQLVALPTQLGLLTALKP